MMGDPLGDQQTWPETSGWLEDDYAEARRYAFRCGYADGRKAWIERCQRIAAEIANPSNPDEVEP